MRWSGVAGLSGGWGWQRSDTGDGSWWVGGHGVRRGIRVLGVDGGWGALRHVATLRIVRVGHQSTTSVGDGQAVVGGASGGKKPKTTFTIPFRVK